ncbi:MAG: hypothetical protein WDA06_00040 [Phenylobacterium sp.]
MISRRSQILQKKISYLEKVKATIAVSNKNLDKIKHHPSTQVCSYTNCESAYNYVQSRFPAVDIKDVKFYLSSRDFLDSLGYTSARGFFNKSKKTIVIASDEKSKITPDNIIDDIIIDIKNDEVVVHELLHYVSSMLSRRLHDAAEEEFAYGYSLQYFKNKGYSNSHIVHNILLPYFMSVVAKDRILLAESLPLMGLSLDEFDNLTAKKKNNIINRMSNNKDIKKIYLLAAERKGYDFIKKYSSACEINVSYNDNIDFIDTIDL